MIRYFKEKNSEGLLKKLMDLKKKLGKMNILPHHVISRQDKETSKVRVVSDTSSKT